MASLEEFDLLESPQHIRLNDVKAPSTLRVSQSIEHSADSQTASEPEPEPEPDKQAAVLHARYTIVCE